MTDHQLKLEPGLIFPSTDCNKNKVVTGLSIKEHPLSYWLGNPTEPKG